jgi:hypothetical protein
VYSVTIKFEKHRINAHTTGTSICESENFKNSCEVMKFVLVPTILGKVTCAWDIHLFYLGVGQKLENNHKSLATCVTLREGEELAS